MRFILISLCGLILTLTTAQANDDKFAALEAPVAAYVRVAAGFLTNKKCNRLDSGLLKEFEQNFKLNGALLTTAFEKVGLNRAMALHRVTELMVAGGNYTDHNFKECQDGVDDVIMKAVIDSRCINTYLTGKSNASCFTAGKSN